MDYRVNIPRVLTLWRWWLLTASALALALVTAQLGHWQWTRAQDKLAQQAQIDQRAQQPALDGLALASLDAGVAMHRQVQLRGQWVPEATVYLDNRQMQGRPGFYVVTPLRLRGTDAVVAVQRGWVVRDFVERMRLPVVATPEGEVLIAGRVAGEPARLYELGEANSDLGASRIRQNLALAAYGRETGLALLPWTVVQTGAASEGLQRDWAAIDSGVDKHYGYAFQWFGLSGLVIFLYVWFQIFRRFFPSARARRS